MSSAHFGFKEIFFSWMTWKAKFPYNVELLTELQSVNTFKISEDGFRNSLNV